MNTYTNAGLLAHNILLICASRFSYGFESTRRMPGDGHYNNETKRVSPMRRAISSIRFRASALALAFAVPAISSAASLDLVAFGGFHNIVAGPDSTYTVQNNDPVTDALLRWGDTGCIVCDTYTSRLGFDGLGSERKGTLDFATIGTGGPFRIGTLLFSTGTLGGDAASVSSADLRLSIQISGGEAADFVFSLAIGNTPDHGDPKHGVPDTLSLGYDFGVYRFSHAGQGYTLDFLGLSLDQGGSFTDMLTVAEGEKIKAGLYAVITPELHPIPLPAAFWLFGSGLLALASLRRRAYP